MFQAADDAVHESMSSSSLRARVLHELANDISCLKEGIEGYRPLLKKLEEEHNDWTALRADLEANTKMTQTLAAEMAKIKPTVEKIQNSISTGLKVSGAFLLAIMSLVGIIYHGMKEQSDSQGAVITQVVATMTRLQERDAQSAKLLDLLIERQLKENKATEAP